MIRVIIAEDNKIEREYIKSLLVGEQNIELVGEAENGREALELIQKLNPDAAIFDINMAQFSGLQVAQKVCRKLLFIFVTAYQDYAIKAFDLGSVDYLLKPIDPARFAVSINRLRKIIKTEKTKEHLLIRNKGFLLSVNIDDIIFLEKVSGKKKIVVYTTDGDYIVNGTLEMYEDKLKPYNHIRTHKSFIANINKVKKLIPWGNKCFMALLHGTKKEVLISRNYAPMVKKSLTTQIETVSTSGHNRRVSHYNSDA